MERGFEAMAKMFGCVRKTYQASLQRSELVQFSHIDEKLNFQLRLEDNMAQTDRGNLKNLFINLLFLF